MNNSPITPEELAELKRLYDEKEAIGYSSKFEPARVRFLDACTRLVPKLLAEVERLKAELENEYKWRDDTDADAKESLRLYREAKQEIKDWKQHYADKVALANKWWADLEKQEQHIAELLDINQRLEQQLAMSRKALELAAEQLYVSTVHGDTPTSREYWEQQAREALGK